MKLGTIVKLGALAVAAGSTAVGTVVVATKAFGKVGGKAPDAPKAAPAPVAPAAPVAPVAEKKLPVEDFSRSDIIEASADAGQPSAPAFEAPVPEAIPVFAEPTPDPVPAFEAPVPEPVSFANVPVAPVVAPVEAAIPDIPAPAAPVDLGYNLPYMAGNSANKDLVAGGVESATAEEPAPVAEEIPAAPVGGSETSGGRLDDDALINQPLKTVEEPAPVVEELPVVEPIAAPIVEPIAEPIPAEPEVVIRQAEPVAEDLTEAPIMEVEPVAAPVEENPLAEGFTVSMHDEPSDALPVMDTTFADLPAANDYIEVEQPAPVAEEPAPIVEPVAPVIAGKEAKIGDAFVSDKSDNANIAKTAAKFGVDPKNLVSIEASGNMPMVFEFLYNDMRNDASLVNVFFVMGDDIVLPPETDKEGVLAFGRKFITDNEELKGFLA